MQSRAWIFVSHASADLAHVRRIRNYMEDKGASPLLFHLMALTNPEEFWPIIEREIQARSFFLYCESEHAEASPWVQKERRAVEKARLLRPISIDHIRVDKREVDFFLIDRFLSKTCVTPIYAEADMWRAEPYLKALENVGFQVVRPLFARTAGMGFSLGIERKRSLQEYTHEGWYVIFEFPNAYNFSGWTELELSDLKVTLAMHDFKKSGRLVHVHLGSARLPISNSRPHVLNAGLNPEQGPIELTKHLLSKIEHFHSSSW